MKNFDSMKIFEHYVKAAFLPAAIAVPFAAGFLILTQVTQMPCPPIAGDLCKNTGPLINNVNTLWGLLWLLISFFIIWFGFWAAISIDTLYSNATSGIKSFGESVGKTALKLPLSVPIPIGGGKSMSVLGLDDAINRINASLSRGEGPGRAMASALPGGGAAKNMRDVLNDPDSASNKSLTNILEALNKQKNGADSTTIDNQIENVFTNNTKVQSEAKEKGITTAEQFRDAVKADSKFQSDIKKIIAKNRASAGGGGGGGGGTP